MTKLEGLRMGMELMAEKGMDVSKEEWTFEEFEAVGLPPIVRCSCCDMTMTLASNFVTRDGAFLCAYDAEMEKEEEG